MIRLVSQGARRFAAPCLFWPARPPARGERGPGRRLTPAFGPAWVLGLLSLSALLAPPAAGAAPGSPAAASAADPEGPASPRPLALVLEGSLAATRGEVDAAYRAFYHAYLLDPGSPVILRHLASAVLHLGDARRAADFAAEGLAIDSTDARLHSLMATALAGAGDREGMLVHMEAAARYDSTDVDYVYQLAHEYDRLDRVEEARRAYERAVALGADDGETLLRYAVVLGRLGRYSEALPLLDEAEGSGADLPTLPLTRAWVLDELGRQADAVPIYLAHLDAHPDDAAVRRRLVNALLALDRPDEALPHARRMYEASPELAEGRVLAGIYLRQRKQDRARDLALELRRRHPGDLEVAEFAVALLGRLGKEDAAVQEARRLTEEAPESFPARLLLAMALNGARRPADAARALEEAEALLPDSGDARLVLGRAYFALGDFGRAERLFTAALAAGADTAAAWYEIAGARERRKDIDGAEEAILRVLDLRPDSPQALNFLGYLYADYDRNLDEAVRLIRRALELDPDNGYIMDSLGWAYYRLGKLDSARVELERALRTGGEDPTILEHLGDVLVALDLPELAREKYRRALELGPEDPAAVREKLSRLP